MIRDVGQNRRECSNPQIAVSRHRHVVLAMLIGSDSNVATNLRVTE
jgi:hypothetical protein